MRRIEELEKSSTIKEDSDRLWHLDYEEMKDGIRKLIERYDPGTTEYTAENMENVFGKLVDQLEMLQKEKTEAVDKKQQLILTLNSKLVDSASAIERLKQDLGKSQKELDERRKAV